MFSDRARHLNRAGAASIPLPATTLPPPPPPSSGRGALRTEVLDEIRRIGVEGFQRGYSAGVDQLTEPIAAVWLASESGLPEAQCRVLLAELRQMLIQAAPHA